MVRERKAMAMKCLSGRKWVVSMAFRHIRGSLTPTSSSSR